MYSLPYFKEQDESVVLRFIKDNPFAFICGVDAQQKPVASQIPVFIDERNGSLFLSGHIMKNTDHHKAFMANPNVLAVFTGAHTYVSASWYSDKQQASTWNYMSVHARGRLRFLDEDALLEVLKRTTNHFENNPYSGANFEDLSPDYVRHLTKAIVAFEVEVEQIGNVFKLSQNRDEKSFHNIIDQLESRDEQGKTIAHEMKMRKAQLFPGSEEIK
jgi:transcriptional regulator